MDNDKNNKIIKILVTLIGFVMINAVIYLIFFKEEKTVKETPIKEENPVKETFTLKIPNSIEEAKKYTEYQDYVDYLPDEMFQSRKIIINDLNANTTISKLLFGNIIYNESIGYLNINCSDKNKYNMALKKVTGIDSLLKCDLEEDIGNKNELIYADGTYVKKYHLNYQLIDSYAKLHFGPKIKVKKDKIQNPFNICFAINNDMDCINYADPSLINEELLDVGNNMIIGSYIDGDLMHIYLIKFFKDNTTYYSDANLTNPIHLTISESATDEEKYRLNKNNYPVYDIVFKKSSDKNSYYWLSTELYQKQA